MPEQLSQIDELFLYASVQEEQLSMDGDWDTIRKKIIEKPGNKRRMIWFFIFSSFGLITALACLYYFFPEVKDSFLTEKNNSINTNNLSNSNQLPVTTASLTKNDSNNDGDTSKTLKKESTNNGLPSYKVQIGAFVNMPLENFYSTLQNVTTEYVDGYHKYYAGEYNNLPDAQKRMEEVTALGFYEVFITSPGGTVSNNFNSMTNYTAQNQYIHTATVNKVTTTQNENVNNKTSQTTAENNTNKFLPSDSSEKSEEKPDNIITEKSDTVKHQGTASVQNKADSVIIKEEFKKYGVGLSWSCNLDKFRIENNNDYGEMLTDSSYDLIQGPGNFAFSLGMQFTYRFTKNVSIETGLLYSQKKKFDLDGVHKGNTDYTFHYNGKYLDIPVRARFYVINNPTNLFVTTGVLLSSNFPVKYKGYFQLSNVDDTLYYERVTLEPASLGLSLQLGAGIDYIIQKKWRLYFAPMYSYSFSPVLKHPTYNNEPVKHYVNSFNLTIGCYYDF